MGYNDLIQDLMDRFYENNMDFPTRLSYPVLCLKGNKIYDVFFVTEKNDDVSNNAGLSIRILYAQNVKDPKEYKILRGQDAIKELLTAEVVEIPPMTGDRTLRFATLYEQVREYAFKETLSKEQTNAARSLAAFYLELLDASHAALYKKLSPRFFLWVKSLENT